MVFLDCIQIVPQIDIFVRSGGIYFDDGTVGGPHSGGMGDTNRTWSSRSGAAIHGNAFPGDITLNGVRRKPVDA